MEQDIGIRQPAREIACLNSTMFRWNLEIEEQLETLKKFKFHYVQMELVEYV